MKAQNNIKKIIAALLSTAIILTASNISGVPFGLNAIAEPAGDSEIIEGGKNDGYHWKYYNADTKTLEDSETTWRYDPNTKTLTIGGTGPMPDWDGTGATNPTENPDHYFFRPWGSQGKIGEIEDARKNIERIVIEEGVTSIGSYAFCNFNTINTELTIEIHNSVTKIGRNAFYNTSRLKSITIPDSVETIDREAFWHAKGLENVKLSEKLTVLNDHVFNDCAFSEITIPKSVTTIANHTFKDCKNLKTIEIPENVTSIGWGAFWKCTSLSTVTFKGTTTIPTLAIPRPTQGDADVVFLNCPCVADEAKGLLIESCAVLEGYQAQNGWSEETTNYKEHIDKTHHIYYTAEGAVITEKCTNDPGCGHTATATLSVPPNTYTYTGSPITPVINTYSDNWYGTDEKKPADTEIKYKNNTKVGNAEATLTILNDDEERTPATAKIGFEIVSALTPTITANGYDGVYDGNSHSITVNVSGVEDSQIESVKYGTTEGTYDLTDNPAYTDAGEYTVYYQITLTDGSVKTGNATVKITPKPIIDSTVTIEVTAPANPGDDPIVTVKDGDKTLTENADYTVTTTETTDTNTGKTTITVNVTGKGNYKDTVTKSVEIDSGNNPGSGDNPGSGGGSNPSGNTPSSGDNPGGNTSGDNPGSDDNSGGNTSGDNPGSDDNSGGNTSDDNPSSDDNPGGNTSGDNPGSDDNSGGNTSDDNPSSDDNPGGNTSGDNPGGDNPGSDDNSGGVNPGGNTSGGDIPDDNSSDDSNSSDNSSETDENNPNKPINPGNVDDSGDVLDISRVPDTSSADDDNQNPTTGNPMGKWAWILLSAAGATGIAVMKSKSNRKEK